MDVNVAGSCLAHTVGLLAHRASTPTPPPPLDTLMLLGFLGAVMQVLFYLGQGVRPSAPLVFSVSCVSMAAYALAQGAWPLAIVEVVLAGSALRRWWNQGPTLPAGKRKQRPSLPPEGTRFSAERFPGSQPSNMN